MNLCKLYYFLFILVGLSVILCHPINAIEYEEGHGITLSSTVTQPNVHGVVMNTSNIIYLRNATFDSLTNFTYCVVLNSSSHVVAKNFISASGKYCNLSVTVPANSNFSIGTDCNGASCTRSYVESAAVPVNKNITFRGRFYTGVNNVALGQQLALSQDANIDGLIKVGFSDGNAEFVYPTPEDGTRNNTKNIIINSTCTQGNVSLFFDYATSPFTLVVNNQLAPYAYNVSALISSEGTYYYRSLCSGGYDITGWQGLVAYFPSNFDSIATNNLTIYDTSGNNNNGQISGNTYNHAQGFGNLSVLDNTNINNTFGYIGKGINFIQSTDLLKLNDSFGRYSALSWSVWVRYAGASALATNIMIMDFAGSNDSFQIYSRCGSSRLRFIVFNDSASDFQQINVSCAAVFGDLNWHMISGTWEGTTGNISMYIDGLLANQLTPSIKGVTANPIGNFMNWNFNGSLDEIMIWNRSLSSTEIMGLYTNGTAGKYAPPELLNENIFYLNGNNYNSTHVFDTHQIGESTIGKGQAMYFDRKLLQKANINVSPYLSNNSGFTVCSWAYTLDKSDTSPILGDIFGSGTMGLRLIRTSANPYPNFVINNGSQLIVNADTTTINVNTWYFICGGWNTTHGLIYVDGKLKNSGQIKGQMVSGTLAGKIGYDSSSAKYFNGSIDEVMIFNRSLSGDEIQALYLGQVKNYIFSQTRSYIYDITNPAKTINPNTFFTEINTTSITEFSAKTNLTVNISVTDNLGLYGFEFNVTDALNETVVYAFRTESLSGLTYNYTPLINYSAWAKGRKYNIDIWASDSHTASLIPDYPTKEITNGVDFKTEKINSIKIYSEDSSVLSTTKTTDRYSFDFKFQDKTVKQRIFYVECSENLIYLSDSKYQGHFICSNNPIHYGNWIDFEGVEGKPIVNQLSKNKYQIIFNNLGENIKFNSIGGLNINHQTYSWFLPELKLNSLSLVSSGNYTPIIYDYPLTCLINATSSYGSYYVNYSTYQNGILQINNLSLNLTSNTISTLITATPTAAGNFSCVVNSLNFGTNYSLINYTNLSTIYGYGIDNCSRSISFPPPSNITALNISFFDYNNLSTNVSYQSTTTFNNLTFSFFANPLSKTSICKYPSWLVISQTTQFLYIDSSLNQYSYFLSSNFTNVTQYLNLYTQNGTSQVAFKVLDLDGNPLAFYKLQILLYSVGTGSYTTTEILQTDSVGQAIGNIIYNTAYYNILVYDTTNTLVKTLSAIRISSSYSLTNPYTITVAGTSGTFYTDFTNSLGVNHALYFNNDTNNFVFTWSDPTGISHNACLRVTNSTYLGITIMSDSCTQSSAGTIVYNIQPINGTRYLGTSYLKDTVYEFPLDTAEVTFETNPQIFTQDKQGSLFITLLLVLLGILIALPNPVLAMLYFILCLIVTFSLGLFMVSLGMLSSIIVLGLTIIYIGGKQQ